MLAAGVKLCNKYDVNSKIIFPVDNLSNFQKRYGHNIDDNTYPTNEFIENIITRNTVRNFTEQKIDPKLLEKLFAAAQSSPTGCMFQPWSAIVIASKVNKLKIFFDDTNITRMGFSTKDSIVGMANFNAITQSDIFVIWCVDLNIITNILENVSSNNLNSSITPDEMASSKEGFDHSIYEIPAMWDAVIAAQTFCLAAESVGLGTMYCGAIKNIDLKKDLNLPDKVMPLFGICVGYPTENLNLFDKNTAVKPRLPQKLVVHNEKYSKQPFEEFMNYNNLISKFYQFYNMSGDWFTRIVQRSQLTNNSRLYKKLINKYGFWLR